MKSDTFYLDAGGNAVWGDRWIPPNNLNREWRKLQAAIAAGEVSKVAAPAAPSPDPAVPPNLEQQLDELWELVSPTKDSAAYLMRERVRNRPGKS